MTKLRILSADDVRQALPMAQAIQGMKEAYTKLSSGSATLPLRSRIDIPEHKGIALFMPAHLSGSDDLAIKVVTVYPNNSKNGMPVIQAIVMVFDASTGQPLALMNGEALTAIRTGAGAGAATDLLAREDAQKVAIIGSGVQARTQLEAVCTVRRILQATVYSLNQDRAREFARSMAGKGPIPENVELATSSTEAVRGADIICTATTSLTPVFPGNELETGTHINAIGAFKADMQEVDLDTIRRSYVVVDSLEAALEEAGDLLIPLKAGDIKETHIQAELGEIALGIRKGRTSRDQITYFKSVGVAVQDVVAGRIALHNAQVFNIGKEIEL